MSRLVDQRPFFPPWKLHLPSLFPFLVWTHPLWDLLIPFPRPHGTIPVTVCFVPAGASPLPCVFPPFCLPPYSLVPFPA